MRRLSTALAAGVALLATPAVGLLAPAPAFADPPVVSATIYGGRQAGITTQTVTAGALSRCQTYTGASPFLLEPGSAAYQPVSGSSWSLATIVECGLRIPAASLTGVAVQSAQRGFEPPLSSADLTDAGHYADPTAPGALPVISLDGGQNQVTYARPERSPSDANAADEVTGSGPVTLAVYENAPPLQVRASKRRLSVSPTVLTEQLAATVTNAGGHPLAPAALSWSWSFGDGSGSGHATVTHAFPLGRWFVTVTVTDRADGTGGTDTIPVSVDTHALTGAADRSGVGHHHRTSRSPSGVVNGAGGQAATSGTAATPSAAPAPPAVVSTPATDAPAAATSRAGGAHPRRSATGHRPSSSRRRRPRRITRARSPGAGRIVRGQLIADVTPVAPTASRLTHAVPAVMSTPVIVRAATHSPAGFSGLIPTGLVVTLLVLGAGREHRSRRRWRQLRPGP